MTVLTLQLALQRRWFEEIQAGIKTEEYRLVNPYWMKRLVGKQFDKLVLTLGYPKRHDTSRRIELPWRGYTVKTIEHPHFCGEKKSVFAIRLKD
jgi:hypothetical protein